MYEITAPVESYSEQKGSKFLAFLEPCADIRSIRIRQEQLRALHPKCVHVVYAARALNEFAQVVEDFSDDFEPKGSSAAPMLAVLRGADILGAIYVVRYFGGTLLGIGGLVRAYGSACNGAIAAAKEIDAVREYVAKDTYNLETTYDCARQIEYLSADYEYRIEYSEVVKFCYKLSQEQYEQLIEKLSVKLPHLQDKLNKC